MTPTIYDASVLYPSLVRNLLMHLAVSGLVQARWTELIHEEWIRNLSKNHADLTPERLNRTRWMMEQAVPDAIVMGFEHLTVALSLPDPDDRHVLAAAIQAGAGQIVTFNLRHFPDEALVPHGVLAISPDDLLHGLLVGEPSRTRAVIERLRISLSHPAYDQAAFLERLGEIGLPRTAQRLRSI